MLEQQNEDGGFGDTPLSHSNISTSLLVIAAAHACGRAAELSQPLAAAEAYVESQGGLAGLRQRYGKDKTFAVPILANAAMAGLVPWREVAALPFEAAWVPQKFYHLLQLPVVSYAIPALVAIGQVKFHHDPPWDPFRRGLRSAAIGPSLAVLERMQPSSGGYLEAVPLTSFVAMALTKCERHQHPVVARGIQFLLDSFRAEPAGPGGTPRGSWPIDTNLATWNTTLAINALAVDPQRLRDEVAGNPEPWNQCLDWLLSCQHTRQHPFTGSPPGGWGWTDLSGAVPDADDTPGALLALRRLRDTGCFAAREEEIASAAAAGTRWLLQLQNRDGGWPTFCRGWGKLPFDRSGADLTAHVLRGLLAWPATDGAKPGVQKSTAAAMERGFRYLSNTQQSDGSWIPLWFGNQDMPDEINPCYGTAKVLQAYAAAGRFDTQAARFGLDWLIANQHSAGGWGGGRSRRWRDSTLGTGSVEETALCSELLLQAPGAAAREAGQRGIAWLVRATRSGEVQQYSPIGFYFAKLWYYERAYPLIFAAAALGRARRLTSDNDDRPRNPRW